MTAMAPAAQGLLDASILGADHACGGRGERTDPSSGEHHIRAEALVEPPEIQRGQQQRQTRDQVEPTEGCSPLSRDGKISQQGFLHLFSIGFSGLACSLFSAGWNPRAFCADPGWRSGRLTLDGDRSMLLATVCRRSTAHEHAEHDCCGTVSKGAFLVLPLQGAATICQALVADMGTSLLASPKACAWPDQSGQCGAF